MKYYYSTEPLLYINENVSRRLLTRDKSTHSNDPLGSSWASPAHINDHIVEPKVAARAWI